MKADELKFIASIPESDRIYFDNLVNVKSVKYIVPVGSRITSSTYSSYSDWDILVYTSSFNFNNTIKDLESIGFKQSSKENYNIKDNRFIAFRSPSKCLNLIVTNDISYYKAFLAATHVAKELNLTKKFERVILFEAVLRHNRVTSSGVNLDEIL